jgi:hypothetical protein
MTTPIRNLTQTIVMGATSLNAIFVAINDAPQTITANSASIKIKSFELGMKVS